MFRSMNAVTLAAVTICAAIVAAPYWIVFRAYMGWRAVVFSIATWAASPIVFHFVHAFPNEIGRLSPFSETEVWITCDWDCPAFAVRLKAPSSRHVNCYPCM